MTAVFMALRKGKFSSGEDCDCYRDWVCATCQWVAHELRMFVEGDAFSRAVPFGRYALVQGCDGCRGCGGCVRRAVVPLAQGERNVVHFSKQDWEKREG